MFSCHTAGFATTGTYIANCQTIAIAPLDLMPLLFAILIIAVLAVAAFDQATS